MAVLSPISDETGANVTFDTVVPVLRIFDLTKARQFYVDYLGFQVDWEHRFAENAPLYMQVSRSGLGLHLSEHHGDGTPGSVVYVETRGVRAYHAELQAKHYPSLSPGIEVDELGTCMTVLDPFGNSLRFNEPSAKANNAESVYRFYGELAVWWPLISPPEDYEEEAAFAATLLRSAPIPVREVLESAAVEDTTRFT